MNDKHEYLTDQKTLPPDQSRNIEQIRFTSLLGKTFEKIIKASENQGQKQIKLLKGMESN